jgi:hypothetical protein
MLVIKLMFDFFFDTKLMFDLNKKISALFMVSFGLNLRKLTNFESQISERKYLPLW